MTNLRFSLFPQLVCTAVVALVFSALIPVGAQIATPTPPSFGDQSVAWQNSAVHDGNDSASPLVPPLTVKWKHDFAPFGVQAVSYPLIAQGLVIVTTTAPTSSSYFYKSLIAFDENTGQQVWSVNITGTYGFANAAYDSGKVFVVNYDGVLQAFNASNGANLWTVQLPNQWSFTSPPTAINGTVYVGGAGLGGTLFAVSEINGSVQWSASVENGDHSSPAVTSASVFVSYACPQSYAFAPASGTLQWHYSGPCEGGGGKTPVYHLGKVYVRDSFSGPTNGLILDAANGANINTFNSDRPPAFVGNLGVYLQSGTLRGVDVSTGAVLWSFAGDGNLVSAPLIANQIIYVGSSTGLLYAVDLQGQQVWSTNVGAGIPAPDEANATLTTGFGVGDGLLVIPTAQTLTAYAVSGTPTPTPTATPTPQPTPSISPGPDQSVTFQNNVLHDGNDDSSHLTPPLTLKWQHDFTSAGVQTVSYPLIAQGQIIVTTMTSPPTSAKSLVAFNEATGQQLWSVAISGGFGFVNAAYDLGKVFVINFDGLLQSFDAATGHPGWSVKMPDQWAFTSPPTAVNGIVLFGGAGYGGTLYAVSETNGSVLWTTSVENGDHSSPAVSLGKVFVSYACPQSYAFNFSTGQYIWNYSGPCEGGGGATPVVRGANLYVRDAYGFPTNGLTLDATTGTNLGMGFNSDTPPAFTGNLALFVHNGTLQSVDSRTGDLQWSFAGDGHLVSAPLVVNQTIYVGSSSGLLYGVDLNGTQIWSTQVGAPMTWPGEGNPIPTTGFGAGDGLLAVPAGPILAVYSGSNATPTPTPTVTPTATPTPTPTPTPTASPTSVAGDGTINAPGGGEGSFSINATKGKKKWKGTFSYSDPTAGVSLTSKKLGGFSITGNQIHFTGSAKIAKKKKATFTVDATDNGEPGTLDTFSISFTTGYSASGNLTTGDIAIH